MRSSVSGMTGPEGGPGTAEGGGSRSVAGAAVRASAWTLGSYAAAQVLRFGSNLILTRLLYPEAFGLASLVFVFMQGLQMFSDVGIGPAIVQSPRGDEPRFLDTAWTIQALRGVALWIVAWALAYPVAAFYGQPLLASLIPVAGLSAVIDGFEATSLKTAQRHLQAGRLSAVELGAQVAGAVVAIAVAYAFRRIEQASHVAGVWAVVAGALMTPVFRLVASFAAFPGVRHTFLLDRDVVRTLAAFGKWVFVSTLLTFLAGQSDRLAFGKMIPLAAFGVYGIALTLATMPTQVISRLGHAVLFPAYAKLAARGEFRGASTHFRRPLLLLGGFAVCGLVATGPFLVRVLYDARYVEAGWMVQILAFAAWFQILEATNGAALLAEGYTAWVAAGSGVKLAGMVAAIPIGFHMAGFRGALVGLVVSDVMKYAASTIGATRAGHGAFRQDVRLSTVLLVTAGIGFAVGLATIDVGHSAVAATVASAAVPVATWGGLGLRYWRRTRLP